jgi:lipid-A-disaccharide synthase-like uncharacterized protein
MIPMGWIGTAGIVAIEGSYLPQIVRLFRLKRAEELSLFFPAFNLAGRLLALTYSLMRADQVFVVGFIIGALMRLTLLLQVTWYRRFPGGASRAPAAPPLASSDEVRAP